MSSASHPSALSIRMGAGLSILLEANLSGSFSRYFLSEDTWKKGFCLAMRRGSVSLSLSVSGSCSATVKGPNQRGSSFLDLPGDEVYGRPLTSTLLPLGKGCLRGLRRLSAWTVWRKVACFLAISTPIFIASWLFRISSTAGILLADL